MALKPGARVRGQGGRMFTIIEVVTKYYVEFDDEPGKRSLVTLNIEAKSEETEVEVPHP